MIVFEQSEERLPMKFSKLVEHVSKKPIPPHAKQLLTEVMVMDEDGEDVEVNSSFYSTFGHTDAKVLRFRFLSSLFVFKPAEVRSKRNV
jgi:Ubiquitin fold domain